MKKNDLINLIKKNQDDLERELEGVKNDQVNLARRQTEIEAELEETKQLHDKVK